jgi:hypothetical protein
MISSAVVSRTGQLSEGCMEKSPIEVHFNNQPVRPNSGGEREGDDSLNERAPCSKFAGTNVLGKITSNQGIVIETQLLDHDMCSNDLSSGSSEQRGKKTVNTRPHDPENDLNLVTAMQEEGRPQADL